MPNKITCKSDNRDRQTPRTGKDKTRSKGKVKVRSGHRYDLRSNGDVLNPEQELPQRKRNTLRNVASVSKQNNHKRNKTAQHPVTDTHSSPKVSSTQRTKSVKQPHKKKSRGRRVSVSIRSRARSSSPSASRTNSSTTANNIVQELKQRIKSISIKGRPVPRTKDIAILGFELKTRLALTSPVLTETGRRGGRVKVTCRSVKKRYIPLWEINKYQDPILVCQVQVQLPLSKD